MPPENKENGVAKAPEKKALIERGENLIKNPKATDEQRKAMKEVMAEIEKNVQAEDLLKAERKMDELEGKPKAENKQLTPEEELEAKIAKATGVTKLVLTIQKFMGKFMEMLEGFKDSLLAMGIGQLTEMANMMEHVSPEFAKFLRGIAGSEKAVLMEEALSKGLVIAPDKEDKVAFNEIKAVYNARCETKREIVAERKDQAALTAFNQAQLQPAVVPAGVAAPPKAPATPPAKIDRTKITPQELKQEYPFKTFLDETIFSPEPDKTKARENWKKNLLTDKDGKAIVTLRKIADLLKEAPIQEAAPAPKEIAPEAQPAAAPAVAVQPPAAAPAGNAPAAVAAPNAVNSSVATGPATAPASSTPAPAPAKPGFSRQFGPPKK